MQSSDRQPDPDELIPPSEAARLLPSPRRGKRTNASTLLRWILSGRLPGFRRGGYWFVRRGDLKTLYDPYSPPPKPAKPATKGDRVREQEWVRKVLDEHGI